MYRLILVLAALMGLISGANTSPNCIGPAVGGRVFSLRYGLILVVVFMLLGIGLEGWKMGETVQGDLTAEAVPQQIVMLSIVGTIIAAGFAVYKRMPITTTQTILLTLSSLLFLSGISLNSQFMGKIVLCWILTPVLSGILAVIAYHFYRKLEGFVKRPTTMNIIAYYLLLFTSAYTAYTLGANTGGFILSTLAIGSPGYSVHIYILAALGIVFGAFFLGRRIIHTVGSRITTLGLTSAMIVQLCAALIIHIVTQFHIPVSHTQAIVGGIVGIGLAYGTREVSFKKAREIALYWMTTPIIAIALSVLIFVL